MNNAAELPTPKFSGLLRAFSIAGLWLGLIFGLMALVAPMGQWFGLWNVRLSMELLYTANEWGNLVALLLLILAVIVFAAAKRFHSERPYRLALLPLMGCFVAFLGYYIPESYRPPAGANIPPIHDITTDTDNPPQFIAVLPLREDAPNSVVYGKDDDRTPAGLAQLQKEAYPDIVPLRTSASNRVVFEQALAVVRELGWDIAEADAEAGRIEATDTTFWFRFKDDVVIVIDSEGGETVVNARSQSRMGRGDVGKNAARLREFLSLLDQRLP